MTLVIAGTIFTHLSPSMAVEPTKPLKLGPAPKVIDNQQKAEQKIRPADPKEAPEPAIVAEAQQTAWLGVMSFPVNDLIASQLDIDGGVALQVVSDESPAAQAGLAVHDIITRLDGQAVKDHLDLRKLIHSKAIGDEIQLDVISKGKKRKVGLTLIARPPGRLELRRERAIPGRGLRDQLRQMGFRGNLQDPLKELLPLMEGIDEKMMREQLQELQGHFQKMNEGFDGLDQLLDEDRADELMGLNLKFQQLLKAAQPEVGNVLGGMGLSSNIKIRDAEGVVEIKAIDGNKELTIKDRAGNILYAGPYNSEEDFVEVPEDLRHRVKTLDFKGNKSLQLRLDHLPKEKVPNDQE